MPQKTVSNHPAVLIAAVLLITFISFLPSLKNDFVNWDDDTHLLENLSVRSLSLENIKIIFTSTVNKTYIPLTIFSFAVEHHFAGFNPFVYHFDNLILHLLCVVLVFIFARGLGIPEIPSVLAALLFGIHPTHVESVAWVTERKDVLYAFFYLAALCFYGKYRKDQKKSTYNFTIICGILSMLAKPMALSLPLVFLLYDWFTGRKIILRVIIEKLPHFLYIIPLAGITYFLNARIPMENLVHAPLVWVWTFSFYIWKFLWPVHLVPLYQLPWPISLFNPHYIFAVLIFATALTTLFIRKKDRLLWFAFLFYFFTIFFLLRFDDAKDATVVSDRFLYVPSIGFCILIGVLFHRFFQKKALRLPVLFFAIFIFGFFSVKTFLQSALWRNSITLWEYELASYPNTPIALNDLATAYSGEKDYLEAVERLRANGHQEDAAKIEKIKGMYEKTIFLDPTYVYAYYNLGNTLVDLRKDREAIPFYLKAIKLHPEYINAYFNLGSAYTRTGDVQKAKEAFWKTISLTKDKEGAYFDIVRVYNNMIKQGAGFLPVYGPVREGVMKNYCELCDAQGKPDCYFNLGWLYSDGEDTNKALYYFEKAIESNPRHKEALYNISGIYKKIGDIGKAEEFYKKVLEIDPRYEEAYLDLGILYAEKKDFDRAISLYQDALRRLPKSANINFNLGFVYETAGKITQAMSYYREALKLKPDHAEAHFGLGNCFAAQQIWREAGWNYYDAIKAKPAYVSALANLSFASFQQEKFDDAVLYFKKARDLGFQAPPEYERALQPYLK